ncbi:nucleoside permease [Reichenbachiella sp. MALMAid0571]|uniref:nucleoside permease n=1 Tax=Reichenbachiella sp. MALMAid0571 TaxID=3143939 RepID=UPI0032DE6B91
MTNTTYVRLSFMMFLQFFIWGGWFVTVGSYLGKIGFSGAEIGTTYLMNNIAAILSPFFIGMVADRFFSSEKVMGVLHIVGGGVIYFATGITETASLILTLLVYNACYMPTLALVNTISFQQMENPGEQFPKIRVWGTIGWIAAGLSINFILGSMLDNVELTTLPLKMAAVISVLLGLYSFTLPNTPPQNTGKDVSIGDILGIKALRLLKDTSFAIFVLCSLLISIPLAFYYSFTNLFLNDLNVGNAASIQSIGQMSEVLFMILMPWFFVRLGLKKMLLVGMLAWLIRYGMFAMGNTDEMVWMLFLGIALHGICYDFFFVTGQIYVDKKAPKDIRASAQGFITLITYGVGMGIGSVISGNVLDMFTTGGQREWSTFWWIPAIFALLVAVMFFITFKQPEDKAESGN